MAQAVLNLKSKNVYDKKQVVEEFEKIRDVFEDIQTKITMKQARVNGLSIIFVSRPDSVRVMHNIQCLYSGRVFDSL